MDAAVDCGLHAGNGGLSTPLEGHRPGLWGRRFFLETALRRGDVNVVGVDIDSSALERARTLLSGYPVQPRLYHQDGLLPIQDENAFWQGEYDLVIGNPPYAAVGHRVRDPELLKRFTLSQEPIPDTPDTLFPDLPAYRKKDSVPIEVLFFERAFQLAKWGGKVALILPISLLAGKKFRYVRCWMVENYFPISIIKLPEETFQAMGTQARTAIVYIHKRPPLMPRDALMVLVEKIQDNLYGRLADSKAFSLLARAIQDFEAEQMDLLREHGRRV